MELPPRTHSLAFRRHERDFIGSKCQNVDQVHLPQSRPREGGTRSGNTPASATRGLFGLCGAPRCSVLPSVRIEPGEAPPFLSLPWRVLPCRILSLISY